MSTLEANESQRPIVSAPSRNHRDHRRLQCIHLKRRTDKNRKWSTESNDWIATLEANESHVQSSVPRAEIIATTDAGDASTGAALVRGLAYLAIVAAGFTCI